MSRRSLVSVGAALIVVTMTTAVIATRSDDGGNSDDTVEEAAGTQGVRDDARLMELASASGFGDPAGVVLPEPANATAREWLDGEGALAVELLDASAALWSVGREACDRVAEDLDAAGTPEELREAATGTPDPPTRDLLLGLYAAIGSALQACADTATFEPAAAQFAWQWALTDRRLQDLGVQR